MFQMLQKLAVDAAAFRKSKLKVANDEKQTKEKKVHKKEENNNKRMGRKITDNESRKVLNASLLI